MKRNQAGRTLFAAAFFSAALASGSAMGGPPRIYVNVAPPVPIIEVHPARPSPGHVWIGGYHTWNGSAYVWTPGRWDAPPRHHARWVAGHWRRGGRRGWYWVQGHWR